MKFVEALVTNNCFEFCTYLKINKALYLFNEKIYYFIYSSVVICELIFNSQSRLIKAYLRIFIKCMGAFDVQILDISRLIFKS